MEYKKTYASYLDYVNDCRNSIKKCFFTQADAYNIDISDSLGINELVKKHRLKMIDIKLDHTLRMIEQIIKINEHIGFKINLGLVIKVAVLYHDIGRIKQATWSNTFSDNIYKTMNKPFNNHGEEGYDIFINNNFNVDEKYIPIIGKTILHHQTPHEEAKLAYQFSSDLTKLSIDDKVTGNFDLNEAEWQITALIVQLVADIDKADILYQYLTNDIEIVKDYILDKSNDSLDNISKKWGISKEEIINYNMLTAEEYKPQVIKIPIKNMDLKKLEVKDYMKRMFYNNSWPELKVLREDENWNFISLLWWRLSYFLNQITFNSTLIMIEESNLIMKIYEKVPNEFKPLVSEAFLYVEEKLINHKLDENKGRIYLKRS